MYPCNVLSFTPKASTEPTTTITTMPTNLFLPEEIILNILLRLPVKSLKRFQCVCKHWNTLIKAPSFIQHHLHHSHQNPSLLVGPHLSKRSFHLLSSHQNNNQSHHLHIPPLLRSLKRLSIEGSCNGLLFLLHHTIHHAYPLLWNPATADVTKIPLTSLDFSHVDITWGVAFGFGFSPITNDCMIVRIHIIYCYSRVYEVEIYSVRTGFWRRVTFDNIKKVVVYGHSVTVNGVIFWRGIKHIGFQNIYVIVSFDMVTEVFTVIPLPPDINDSHQLAVYDDKLALISYDKNNHSQSFPLHFHVMEEGGVDSCGERWSSSEEYIGRFGSKLLPMTIWRNHIVSFDSGMVNATHLYLIDVSTKECRQLDIPKLKHGCGYGVSVFNYVESLIPVGGDFQIEEP